MNTEDQLSQMLRDRAEQMTGKTTGGTGFDQVRSRAHRIRRRRRTMAAAAIVAAVVVVTVPTTLLLQGGPEASSQLPAHSTTPTPTPTPTSAPPSSPTAVPTAKATGTPQRALTLASIPRAADLLSTYLDPAGIVHDAGSQQPLPGGAAGVISFEAFKGGWLVLRNTTGRLTRYDGSGAVLGSGNSNGGIATTSDNTEVAYQLGNSVFYGSVNTMGNGGPTQVGVGASQALIGFVQSGPVVTDGTTLTVLAGNGQTQAQPQRIGLFPTATSESADLIGGLAGTVAKGNLEGAVYDMKSGNVLWHNQWRPTSFSDDGRYVAAFPVYDNGDPSSWAILDARTGRVVAQLPKLGPKVYLGSSVTWQHDQLILTASQGADRVAMLALTPSGTLTRVSDVVPVKTGAPGFVFAAGN